MTRQSLLAIKSCRKKYSLYTSTDLFPPWFDRRRYVASSITPPPRYSIHADIYQRRRRRRQRFGKNAPEDRAHSVRSPRSSRASRLVVCSLRGHRVQCGNVRYVRLILSEEGRRKAKRSERDKRRKGDESRINYASFFNGRPRRRRLRLRPRLRFMSTSHGIYNSGLETIAACKRVYASHPDPTLTLGSILSTAPDRCHLVISGGGRDKRLKRRCDRRIDRPTERRPDKVSSGTISQAAKGMMVGGASQLPLRRSVGCR